MFLEMTLFYYYYYSTVHRDHIFFIHSPVDVHLGCFNVLAMVNTDTMNTEVHVSL